MASKIKISADDLFEDVTLVAIVTPMSDFTLAWNLNNTIHIDLKKMTGIVNENSEFSFYYYNAGENMNVFNLVQLSNGGQKLLKLPNHFDYMLIIRNSLHENRLNTWLGAIRKIQNISIVSLLEINNKILDLFLEKVEFHEFRLLRENNRSFSRLRRQH